MPSLDEAFQDYYREFGRLDVTLIGLSEDQRIELTTIIKNSLKRGSPVTKEELATFHESEKNLLDSGATL